MYYNQCYPCYDIYRGNYYNGYYGSYCDNNRPYELYNNYYNGAYYGYGGRYCNKYRYL